jgi:hypothetical protein
VQLKQKYIPEGGLREGVHLDLDWRGSQGLTLIPESNGDMKSVSEQENYWVILEVC